MINKKRIGLQKIKTQLESHYGIGKIQSKLICNQLGISLNLRNNQITKYERKKIMDYLRKRMRIVHRTTDNEGTLIHTVNSSRLPAPMEIHEGLYPFRGTPSRVFRGVKMINKINNSPIVDNLKYIQKNNILDLMKKNTYRGFRHKKGLPVRGQRTRTNRQTSKKLSRRVSHRAGAQRNK